jgi:uncharacterized repeat protein (TIGR03803 family)
MGGGANSSGTVFRFSTNGTETMLYSFAGSTNDGSEPVAPLVLGSDGNFYGTTFFGGITNVASIGFVNTLGLGTVFRISPGGSYQLLYLFGSTVPDGFAPGQLVQASDGNFYGVAFEGGTFTNHGAVFRITPGGSESLFYSFGSQPGDASSPSSLMIGSDGNFYGTTTKGGTNDIGAVFRISPGGSETVLYSFGSQPNDGNEPLGWLVQANGGNLYGTTLNGGAGTEGTIFELTGAIAYPTNQITQIRLAGTNVVLGILSATGDTYQLQSTTNLVTAGLVECDWSLGDEQRRGLLNNQFWRSRWPAEILSVFDQPVRIEKEFFRQLSTGKRNSIRNYFNSVFASNERGAPA